MERLPMSISHDIFTELQWRGLIHQTTDEAGLPQWLMDKPRCVYAGFDPTSDSLHVGNMMPLMLLRRFQQAGHRPIALAGGSTGLIGDPSGKSAERNLLSPEKLAHNLNAIQSQLRHFLDFDCGENSALLVNNYDWMNRFGYLDFLREIGKNFPVNVMMAKDSIKGRLEGESGLSYTEFSYMLLQAYDFAYLSQSEDCQLQVGGSDQWGNITAGIDLGRRMHGVQLFGLTCPLLVKSDGGKMGKTEAGAIWLSPERTSPYAFYQYWYNVDDNDVSKCLRFLTELPKEEIEALDEARVAEPGKRASQIRLAESLTTLVHGAAALEAANRAREILFGAEIADLDDTQLMSIFDDVPSQLCSRGEIQGDGMPILDALVKSGLAKSKSEARRTVQQGGAYVNNRRHDDIEDCLTESHLASETVMVLRSGRKRYALLRFED